MNEYDLQKKRLEEAFLHLLEHLCDDKAWLKFFTTVRGDGANSQDFKNILDLHLHRLYDFYFDDGKPLPEDPIEAWKKAHPEEVEKYKGKHVAVHPERGVVASADTLEEVVKIIRANGEPQGSLCLVVMY